MGEWEFRWVQNRSLGMDTQTLSDGRLRTGYYQPNSTAFLVTVHYVKLKPSSRMLMKNLVLLTELWKQTLSQTLAMFLLYLQLSAQWNGPCLHKTKPQSRKLGSSPFLRCKKDDRITYFAKDLGLQRIFRRQISKSFVSPFGPGKVLVYIYDGDPSSSAVMRISRHN